MRRRSAPLLGMALAVMMGLPLAAGPSGAATAPRAVDASDLPTVDQTARHYPAYAGGSRSVFRGREIALISRDCLAYVSGPNALSGRWASYLDADGGSPYFYGEEVAAVFVYEFRNATAAGRVLRTVRDDVARCIGTSSEPGFLRRRSWADVPRIGDARPLAWFGYIRSRSSGEVHEDRSMEIWVRTGRRLVNVTAQKELSRPSRERLVGLARTSTRVAS